MWSQELLPQRKASVMSMRLLASIALWIGLAASLAVPAYAAETLWDELNAMTASLYQQGRYLEAAKVAKEALKVAENSFGPNHANVATSLYRLAVLYKAQRNYAAAEPLYQRALALWEETLGPTHLRVATVVEQMAGLYKKMGRRNEAERFEKRAKQIRARHQ